ncbi:hypothetical protein CLU79DRAFT_743764 [Phycomyces nitens]|nr:hypothetical protein CLU79DRAFT_743764 [Phycomyces nitens]
MISYFILNKSGDLIYQSVPENNPASVEGSKIRFLPLILIKDLIKANFRDRIQYVKSGKRTVAFWEKSGVFYVAWTRDQTVPVSLLHHHLRVIHRFLRFNYGPQWFSHLQGPTLSRTQRAHSSFSLSTTNIASCLSHLPFLIHNRLCAKDILCHVEQVEVHEDLRNRLTRCLETSCLSTLVSPPSRPPTKLASFFTPPKRTIHGKLYTGDRNFLDHHASEHMRHWTHAFLFAKEKIVSHCLNHEQSSPKAPDDLLMFLQLLVAHYLGERQPDTEGVAPSLPQPIARPPSPVNSLDKLSVAGGSASTESASSPPIYTSSSETASHNSSFAYISNTTSAPFKIRKKSSSATVMASASPVPSVSWSSPPPLIYSHLLSHLPKHAQDSLSLDERHFRNDCQSDDSNLPRNATIKHRGISSSERISTHQLSSSFPTETEFFMHNHQLTQSSAPSSPKVHSRANSLAEPLSTKGSVKSLLVTFLQGEEDKPPPETSDVEGMLVWRWMSTGDTISLCSIFVTGVGDGLCAVVVSKEDDNKPLSLPVKLPRPSDYAYVDHLKAFRAALQEDLKDFMAFLLIKEAAHFTILSFIASYPGLVHFIYLQDGRMIAPQLVDLESLDKNCEALRALCDEQGYTTCNSPWRWPTLGKLRRLSKEMMYCGLACREDDVQYQMEPSLETHRQGSRFNYVYQRGPRGEELFGLYFGLVSPNRVWPMHRRLLQDISQRMV